MEGIMIKREMYLNKMLEFRDTDFVKILTGVRRSGKSTLLELFKEELLSEGIKNDNIIEINYEKYQFSEFKSDLNLHEYIKTKIVNSNKTYLLIDEVQELSNWAEVINSLRVSFNIDIYITGSNARLFSSESLTYLSGRYVEIKVFPLSFKEFLMFKQYGEENAESYFDEYLRIGSFPAVSLAGNNELVEAILSGLFDSIFTRDIVLRGKIKDEGAFYKVAKFVFENIGNNISANKIKNTLSSNGHKISSDTVDNYLKLMCDAHMLYQCERYDIRGKERLKTNGKYYVVDTGLRNRLIGYKQSNLGHIIENIVYLELLRQGFAVSVGKHMEQEVDFICSKENKISYIQVCLSALDENTYARELKPLLQIKDQYPKYLISMDKLDLSSEGIIHINLIDLLINEYDL